MNYKLTKKQAKELIESKLSHFFGVSPEEATYEHYYKAVALIVRDMMIQGRNDFYKEYKNIKSYYINKIKRKEIYYEALSLDRIWNNNISFRDFDDSKSNFENDIIKLKKFIRIFKIIKILLLSIAIITNTILFINVIIYGLTNI